MSGMKQIALDIGLSAGPTLASFCAGPNEAALRHLQLWAGSPTRSPVPTYLWGASGSGKTHLLKAVCEALHEQGAPGSRRAPAAIHAVSVRVSKKPRHTHSRPGSSPRHITNKSAPPISR